MKTRVLVSAVAVAVAVAAVIAVVNAPEPEPSRPGPTRVASAGGSPNIRLREGGHSLAQAPAGSPVLVEFVDLESEASRRAEPVMAKVRTDYDGRVNFVTRFFVPTDKHANAKNAALAAEAAADQGRLEPMISRLYETRADWAELDDSKAPLFRQFAQELGLDMARYDADVASPVVRARVEDDRRDAGALEVADTPALFLDGKKIDPKSEEGLRQLLDAAMTR